MAAEPVNVSEFQELARLALPKMYYDFYSGGAEDQQSLRENVEAFRRITFRPRILIDVSRVDLSTSILGYNISAPIIVAPTALHQLAHPQGEVATAKAAATCNTIMVLSFTSSCTIEEVATSCNAVRFYQLYIYKRRDIAATLVQRAEKNGFKAIVLTADTPRLGRREADIKNKMIAPQLKNLEGLFSTKVTSDGGSNLEAYAKETMDPSLSWKDIEWLRSITKLPILIKGLLTREDGQMAAEPVNVSEFQELARLALPKMYYDYYSGGAEDQQTLRENVEAFRRITFRPRILIDVSRVDLSTSILGYNISAPIIVAPTGSHQLAHPQGEVATAKAAATCNTIMVLSFSSSCTIEEVATSCDAVRFYQLYIYKRRDIAATLVQRAEKNGFKAIVLTADTPRIGRREADIKNKMIAPQLKNLEGLFSTKATSDGGSILEAYVNETMDPSLFWKDIEWLRSVTKLPILIKGVLTREDAIKAVQVGLDGIIVSNHGARQLDYSPATISILEEVVHAVEGRVPVLMDGGIRRGTDVFKALALGAQAVLVGRPVIYGLAAKGEYGVRRVLEMLKDEFELTMALSGCSSVKDITRRHVRTEHERLLSMM